VTVRAVLFAPVLALLCALAARAADEAGALASKALDLAATPAVVDLGPSMSERPMTTESDGGRWFTIAVQNSSKEPIGRVLEAGESPNVALALVPPSRHPTLIDAAASDPMVLIERETAYGANAFRIVLPAEHVATLGLHFAGAIGAPSVLAWSEPALILHNREIALLNGLVVGLLAAAMAFAAGAAVFSGRVFARWATLFLAGALLANLSADGVFDGPLLGQLGGPYGLAALALAVTIAAGIRLVDYVAAFEAFHPHARRLRDWAALAIVVSGLAAFAGVPAAGLLVRVLALLAASAAAGYLAHCGRLGIAGARRLAPAATIFALVAAVAGFNALGLFGPNLVASGAIGGFAAAGALVMALSASIPTEHAIERLRELREAHRDDDSQAMVTDETLERVRELAAVTASHQGVFELDLRTGLLSLSAEGASIFGFPAGAVEIGRQSWLARIHPDDRDVYEQAIETYRRHPGAAFRLEFRARVGTRSAWFELRATMIGQGTEAERCLGLIADVTARKLADAPHPASVDALTGLGTRAALLTRLDTLDGDFGRTTLAVLDIDRFKAVNDSLGHGGADALLRAAAMRLRERVCKAHQPECGLYRAGGDMFVAIGLDVLDTARFGESLLAAFAVPFGVQRREVFLPVSIGIASAANAEDGEDLLAQAELAMIDAKRQGGARVCLYSSTLTAPKPPDTVALETDLRHALERGQIEVHYQPIVRLRDDHVAGFEALMRWRHPERGLIEPAGFIPYAEQSGLIGSLGEIVLRHALRDIAIWQKAFPASPPLFVSVNVAWRQIADESFARTLAKLVAAAKLPRRSLRLEITESAVMQGQDLAEAALERLRKLGVGLAIDDFGTGHSSLGHLRRFPFDTIKIDKCFLAESGERTGAAILKSMIALAHELRLAVVAEGVESETDVQRLARMGCEYGQGFLFGPPLPADNVPGFIAAPSDAGTVAAAGQAKLL
jgi:diguanylate cyclase (GGDEF)-like protein/PAS domain S-box-containing protein